MIVTEKLKSRFKNKTILPKDMFKLSNRQRLKIRGKMKIRGGKMKRAL